MIVYHKFVVLMSVCYKMKLITFYECLSQDKANSFGDLWTLLAPITIWCISTTRCTRIFSAHKRPPAESIKLMWHTIITTLRAQYERIAGSDDVAELMRLNFRKRWCTTPMAATNGMDIQWKYEVPRWLFPPPMSWTRGVKEMACGIVNVGDG